MTPGIPIFILIAGGLLYALNQKKKAAEEATRAPEEGAPPPPVQAEEGVPPPPGDQGIPPLEPSPPVHPPYQPRPVYGAPPPGQQLPPGVVENWSRATQSDVNRDGMLARFKELLYSDKPVGSEVRIYQNGRWWKLKIVSRQTDPTTTQDRDVRGWLLPAGTPPPSAQPPGRGRPAPGRPRPAPPGRAPGPPGAPYPARPPYAGPIPHRPAPPPPHVAPYPGAGYPAPGAPHGYPPPPAHAAYPPHVAPAYPSPGYPPHGAPGYPQPLHPPHPGLAFAGPSPAPYGAPPHAAPPHGAPPPHAAPAPHGGPLPRPAPGTTAAFTCRNWVRATDHDVARDGVVTIFQSMLGLPAGTDRPPEQHNGRWWKFRVVSKASDPQESLPPGKTKDVRGWVCQDSASAAAGNGGGGGIVGYMLAHNVPRLPPGEYSVHVETGAGFAPLVSGNAPQIAAGYAQWLSGGGNPNSTVYVRQAS